MRYPCLLALALGALSAGIASPQSVSNDIVSYLTLTDAQIQSINGLNTDFSQYTSNQEEKYTQLQWQAEAELAQDSPDPGVVGNLYGQMEMIRRGYYLQLAQVQSNVAAVLTPDQAALVSALLSVARLQPLVSEAQCVSIEPPLVVPTMLEVAGDFRARTTVSRTLSTSAYRSTGSCYSPSLPIALVNYLNISDAQGSAIESANQTNQSYVDGQSLKIQQLQYAIQALTAAQTIDTATLGADYVAIAQIQHDEATQATQLMNTVRSVLTDQQQPQLKALDNAYALGGTEYEAVYANILVLPPDLSQSCPFPDVAVNCAVTIY